MKKILIIAIICFWASHSFAQESDPWVGTWYSEPANSSGYYQEIGKLRVDVKVVVRIDKYGEGYRIRTKQFPINRPDLISYKESMVGKVKDGRVFASVSSESSKGTHHYWNWCYTLNDGVLSRVCYNAGYYGGGSETVNVTDWEKGTTDLGQPITFYKDDDF